jgi:methionyl aminopeptidase
MVKLKSTEEIGRIRESAKVVAETLGYMKGFMNPGITTRELDEKADTFIRDHGGVPSFLGYMGYPASVCISINEEVVHGIPGNRVIREGDIVGIDVGVVRDGYHGDAAWTFAVGDVSEEVTRLLDVGQECLMKGIDAFRIGNRIGDVGHAIQSHAESSGYGVVRTLVGHGIGEKLHEDPQVPNYGSPGEGTRLRPGMVCAIEPMITMGGWEVETLSDQWTIVTRDKSLAVHFEHTVALTDGGPEILSLRRNGNIPAGGSGAEDLR